MLSRNKVPEPVSNLSASESRVKPIGHAEILKNLYLLGELIRRDFRVRFTGSVLGVAWAVLQPLSLVVLYWFIFTFMIPRTPTPGTTNYALFLISGLLPWIGFNEGITRGTTAIVENAPMVRRLTFRSELLVAVPQVTAVIFELIGIGLLVLFLAFRREDLSGLWVLPFAVLVQLILQTGIALFLATLFVFFRDVIQVLGFLLSMLFYLSPILYPVQGRFENFFFWNPLTPLLGLFRSASLSAPLPDLRSVVFLLTVTVAVFAGGVMFFRRARPSLADLI